MLSAGVYSTTSYYGVRRPLHQFGLFASERLLKPPYIVLKVQLLQRFATFEPTYDQSISQECTTVTNSVNAINLSATTHAPWTVTFFSSVAWTLVTFN